MRIPVGISSDFFNIWEFRPQMWNWNRWSIVVVELIIYERWDKPVSLYVLFSSCIISKIGLVIQAMLRKKIRISGVYDFLRFLLNYVFYLQLHFYTVENLVLCLESMFLISLLQNQRRIVINLMMISNNYPMIESTHISFANSIKDSNR